MTLYARHGLAAQDRATRLVQALLACCGLIALHGCAQPFQVRATDYQLTLHMNPADHTLAGRADMTLRPLVDQPLPKGDVWIALDLNQSLEVTKIKLDGAELRGTSTERPPPIPADARESHPAPNHMIHRLHLAAAAPEIRLSVDYRGALQQDIERGEKAGEIHNFGVSAHIGPEGVYLSPEGHWYPSPHIENEESVDADLLLADWRVEVDAIEDFPLVATGEERDEAADRNVWVTPRKLTGFTLTGGPHDVWSRREGDVDIRVHMKRSEDAEEQQANQLTAAAYLDHAAEYIKRYETLLGPFPYSQYTIIENFFSSGFAFPMMTLFGPVVMHMGDNSFRHGYLDHELVHSWWGCGVEVDPRDGNWCEALTSYCTNYFGHVIDGDNAAARKTRRDQSNFLSRIEPADDKPLGTFGLKDGVGRGIAYSKGAAVFHMLARRIGQDQFWNACRTITAQFMGRHADWNDLKDAFERTGFGVKGSLDRFFAQWVRGSGAPLLTLESARYDPGVHALAVTISQGATGFMLDLPLRLEYADRTQDVIVPMNSSQETIVIPTAEPPRAVELDPDYHVFRKLKDTEIMPTTATTKSADTLTIVIPPGDLAEAYATVADSFRKPREAHQNPERKRRANASTRATSKAVTVVADDKLTPEMLSAGSSLILGEAVRHPVLQALLARSTCPVRWSDKGFGVGDQYFTEAEQAVLVTVHHPDHAVDGITIYAGNSEAALANASILGFYSNSLLVFESQGKTKVILRDDFESHQRVEVTQK